MAYTVEPLYPGGGIALAALMEWRLRELMARRRMTNAQLAEALGGLHPVTVSRWRSAVKMPALGQETIEAIAAALQVSEAELLGLG